MTLVRALSTPVTYLQKGQPALPGRHPVGHLPPGLGRGRPRRARWRVSAVVTRHHRRRPARHRRCSRPTPSPSSASRSAGSLFALFMATLMLPIEVTLIPNVQTMRSLELAQLLPGAGASRSSPPRSARSSSARASSASPTDLRDASQLDGFGHLAFLRRVAIPVTRPVIASFAVISFLGAWNQYTWPRAVVSRGEVGDHPDRAQVPVGGPARGEQHRAGRGHHRGHPDPGAADRPATPAHPRPHRRRGQGMTAAPAPGAAAPPRPTPHDFRRPEGHCEITPFDSRPGAPPPAGPGRRRWSCWPPRAAGRRARRRRPDRLRLPATCRPAPCTPSTRPPSRSRSRSGTSSAARPATRSRPWPPPTTRRSRR